MSSEKSFLLFMCIEFFLNFGMQFSNLTQIKFNDYIEKNSNYMNFSDFKQTENKQTRYETLVKFPEFLEIRKIIENSSDTPEEKEKKLKDFKKEHVKSENFRDDEIECKSTMAYLNSEEELPWE